MRFPIELIPVDDAVPVGFSAQEHVLADGHERNQGQLLVHNRDAGLDGLADRIVWKMQLLTRENDLALVGIRGIDAREDLHQGGLARAVLAAKTMDGSPRHLERYVLERQDPRERLRHVLNIENVVARIIHVCVAFRRPEKIAPSWLRLFPAERRERGSRHPLRDPSHGIVARPMGAGRAETPTERSLRALEKPSRAGRAMLSVRCERVARGLAPHELREQKLPSRNLGVGPEAGTWNASSTVSGAMGAVRGDEGKFLGRHRPAANRCGRPKEKAAP